MAASKTGDIAARQRPDDAILDAMNEAVAATNSYKTVVYDLARRFEAMFASHVQLDAPAHILDAHGAADPDTADAKHTLLRDMRSADILFRKELFTATNDFDSAQFGWEKSEVEYVNVLSIAETSLRSMSAEAVDAYRKKVITSPELSSSLYCKLEIVVSGELQAYQASVGAAAQVLGTAAGTLLSAFVTYTAAIADAQVKKLIAEATANGTYWLNVESSRRMPDPGTRPG